MGDRIPLLFSQPALGHVAPLCKVQERRPSEQVKQDSPHPWMNGLLMDTPPTKPGFIAVAIILIKVVKTSQMNLRSFSYSIEI